MEGWVPGNLLRARAALSAAIAVGLLGLSLALVPAPPRIDPGLRGPEEPRSHEGIPTSCSDCHAGLPESLSSPVAEFNASVHFDELVTCVDCHGGDPTASTLLDAMSPARGYVGVPNTTAANAACAECHSIEAAQYRSGVHDEALPGGDSVSASCVDCHGAHFILPASDRNATTHPAREPGTCGGCHTEAETAYEEGAHWRRVLEDLQGATCSDCHRSHDILPRDDPASSMHPRREPATCAACHSSAASISGWYYGVKTDRLGTYQESYHSRALKYGDERVATCTDCHEDHAVRAATDRASAIHPDNLPRTCGQCHDTEYSATIAQGLVHDREAAHSGELRWGTEGLTPAERSYYLGPFDLGYWVPLFFGVLIPSMLTLLALVVILGNVRMYLEARRK